MSKSFESASLKKAIRQRYEDLINNLSPMVEVEEEWGGEEDDSRD